MSHNYKFPRAALTVDCVVFGLDDEDLKVLLIQRDLEPFAGKWALPGGFVHVDETLDQAARRELQEEAGLTKVFLEQLYTFGDLNRDPRERVVTVAYYSLVNIRDHRVQSATDARNAAWFRFWTCRHYVLITKKLSKWRCSDLKVKFGISRLVSNFCQRIHTNTAATPL